MNPIFLWRMTGVHETTRTILCDAIVVEHTLATPPAYVHVNGYASPATARRTALDQLWVREEHNMRLTGLWVLTDITGDTVKEIRVLYDLYRYRMNLTEHLEARVFDVIADIETHGVRHHA